MNAQENQGCLYVLLKLLGLTPKVGARAKERLPYQKRDDFLSAAELSFYHVLRQVVADRFAICCKVRIADVLFVANRRENQSFANKIDRKHVDFVLCDPSTMIPKAAVELDDSSHGRSDRQDRDQLVDGAFAAAGLPLVRFAARRQYDLNSVANQLAAALREAPSVVAPPVVAAPDSQSPACPKCSAPMVVREAKRGPNQGQQFYACPNYPQCKSTLPFSG